MKKVASSNDIDLIKIGRNMKDQMDKLDKTGLQKVIIENQISPIANRMKTIQGMLAQYFIMTNTSLDIEFVSSANKLKQFSSVKVEKKGKPEEPLENTFTPKEDTNINPEYKQHKRDGVEYCTKILNSNADLNPWMGSLDIKKKDDLADCFLQGLWYLKHHKIISFAENLKINIVSLS
jgi:hypothetical protein